MLPNSFNQFVMPRRLRALGLHLVLGGALLLVCVLSSASLLSVMGMKGWHTAASSQVSLSSSIPAAPPSDAQRGEDGQRLLRAVERFLRTLAQNRSTGTSALQAECSHRLTQC